jgi:hypothetical protein
MFSMQECEISVKENLWKTRCVKQFDFLEQILYGLMHSCSGKVQTNSGIHLASCPVCTRGNLQGGKVAGV